MSENGPCLEENEIVDGFVWKSYPCYKQAKNGFWDPAREEYPYICYSGHYLRRQHSMSDNLPWCREAFQNPLWMNAQDAEKLDIKLGDTVLVTSKNGSSFLRIACPTNLMVPGACSVPHGAWVDVDEETGIDRAGSHNYITMSETSGMGVHGYNSSQVKIEKWTGDALQPDHDWPQRIIDAQQ